MAAAAGDAELVWTHTMPFPMTVDRQCKSPGCKGLVNRCQLITWPESPCRQCHGQFLSQQAISSILHQQDQLIRHYGGILNNVFAKSRLQSVALRALGNLSRPQQGAAAAAAAQSTSLQGKGVVTVAGLWGKEGSGQPSSSTRTQLSR